MIFHYQLVVLGKTNDFIEEIIFILKQRFAELEIDEKLIKIVDSTNYKDSFLFSEPAYCIYFGHSDDNNVDGIEKEDEILTDLINHAVPVLPIVSDVRVVNQELPTILHKINAISLDKKDDCEILVSRILEGFSLLRNERKIFISYKRAESSDVALQLYEKLERHGFDVFLDTHSIQPAENFQEELFHRMADCDVILMLNTKEFFTSKWTTEEFDKANSMSIGIVQLIWPEVGVPSNAKLFIPLQLRKSYFSGKKLVSGYLDIIVNRIESIRARSLAARRTNISVELIKAINENHVTFVLHTNGMMLLENFKEQKAILVIPSIGVPNSRCINEARKLIENYNCSEVYIIYDHTFIRDRWLEYLDWLNAYLPVKTIKISEVSEWLKY